MQQAPRKPKSGRRKFNVCPDQFLRSTWELMFDDLNSSVPMKREWFGVHSYTGPSYRSAGPYTFKVLYQLENFFKRCIMKEDRSFDLLASECLTAFMKDQQSYLLPNPLSWYSEQVLFRASQIVHLVLGQFEFSRLSKSSTFGKKAARGLPLRKSYLDNRVKTLTGTSVQWEWFKACLNDDIHLNRAIRASFKDYQEVMDIDVVPVPKSFKAARIIAPDTVLGGFLSRGLGDYIREELERWTHIDLAKQQARHRSEAQKASKDGKRATIDMSKASDSFTMEHVLALMPDSWHGVIEAVRTPIGVVDRESDPKRVSLRSAMLMGSGHTFPLQTLLFYSLAKAVVELSGSKAKVDVYGDDIMLPSKFAPRFYTVMRELGFTINVDKSFHEGHFRESCGGDYLAGLDVRPFMPEYETKVITQKNEYVAFVHKVYNGLLERWSLYELPRTFNYIIAHLLAIRSIPAVVPYHEPPDSGLYAVMPELAGSIVQMPRVNPETQLLEYKKLVARARRRKPRTERIYYWYSLRPQGMINAYDGEVPPGCLDETGCEPTKGGSTVHRWVDVNLD